MIKKLFNFKLRSRKEETSLFRTHVTTFVHLRKKELNTADTLLSVPSNLGNYRNSFGYYLNFLILMRTSIKFNSGGKDSRLGGRGRIM
jgi:hypothetical protein